jgi:hypothetical protein
VDFSPRAIFWGSILVLINIFSIVNVGAELVQAFNFRQVHEIASDFCNPQDPQQILYDLYRRREEVVFINFKYDPYRCFTYKDHNWNNTNGQPRTLRIGFENKTNDHLLYLWFPVTPYGDQQLTSREAFSVRLYKGTADNPFTIERSVRSSTDFDVEGLYFVNFDSPEPGYAYTFTLKPTPFTDELLGQMKCLQKPWWSWAKRLWCSWL